MRLHVLHDGPHDETAVLLLHALPLDHRMWAGVAAAVHDRLGRRVVAVDLPDRAEPGEPSFDAVADRLAELVTRPVVVVGCSMGGYLALALAQRHPGLVAGLGLVDTRAEADDDAARARRAAMVSELESTAVMDPAHAMVAGLLGATTTATRPELVSQVHRWIDEQTPATVAWCQRAIGARPDRTQTLGTFDGPVVVVVGDQDVLSGVDVARQMATTAGAPLVIVPQAGHLSPVEQPRLVAEALVGLVRRA
ncbi:MAG: alpha/beta hydrolase [Micrococcales bacterium]|nr:alpha/beta hydrolase [Micrococcales bacterium]MCL2668406.1 alpha/beta hydrolase [Micrococcales bacterium]